MGMFSTIRTPTGNYQFKTGFDDDLGVYEVGDRFPWKPDNFWPGAHVDGVHNAYPYWVVIKDCVIVALEPFGPDDGEPNWSDDCLRLREQYGITEPPRELWPESAWLEKAERQAKYEADYAAWKAQHGDNPAGWFMHCMLQERSFASQIFPATRVGPAQPSGRAASRAEKLAKYREEKKARKRR